MYGILILVAVVGAPAHCRPDGPSKQRLHKHHYDPCAGDKCQGCATCGYGSYDYRILFDYPWYKPARPGHGPTPAFVEPGDLDPHEAPQGPALQGAVRKPQHVVRKIHDVPQR